MKTMSDVHASAPGLGADADSRAGSHDFPSRMSCRMKLAELAVVGLVLTSILFGSTYQLPIWFIPDRPQGYTDTTSYLRMFGDDYQVSPIHRYRWLVPTTARAVHQLIGPVFHSPQRAVLMSFYLVNFSFMACAGVLLFYILKTLGFSSALCLTGGGIFASSQVTAYTVGLPLVDAPYFFAIAVLARLYQRQQVGLFALASPLLVLTKETLFPFVWLALLARPFRCWRVYLSFVAGGLTFVAARAIIDGLFPVNSASGWQPLTGIVGVQLKHLASSLAGLATGRGLVMLGEAFLFVLVLAAYGYMDDVWQRRRTIPLYFQLMFPLAALLAVLSNNYGRMLFAAYIPVIAYSLLAVKQLLRAGPENDPAKAAT
jgi:hypothetical protein